MQKQKTITKKPNTLMVLSTPRELTAAEKAQLDAYQDILDYYQNIPLYI